MHRALYTVNVGRGYGTCVVPVMDVVRLVTSKGKSAVHVVAHAAEGTRTICGREYTEPPLVGIDARAVVVYRNPVCVNCLDQIGTVPDVELLKDREVS